MPQKRSVSLRIEDSLLKKKRPEHNEVTHHAAYEALDTHRREIRILVVEPGSGNEPVRCTFQKGFLNDDSSLKYETISYVWGDASKRDVVFLHGQPCDVPASSAVVLRRMRDATKPRRLWLDAICINQNDLQERNRQVAIMGYIYSSGTTNLIWLGEDDGTTGHAIASIQAINEEMRSETGKGTALKDLLYPGGTMTTCPHGLKVRVRESALRRFFESRWFSRVWVIQEAALSPRSVCIRGGLAIAFPEVMRAALWIRFKQSKGAAERLDEAGIMSTVCSLADWTIPDGGYHTSRPLHRRTLAALLSSFRVFQAFDPRDHVFAIADLWLAKSGALELPPELTPDYSASLADVLRQATRFAMKERGDLEILKIVSHQPDEQRLPGLPTWAHRWDTDIDVQKDPSTLVHHDNRADAHVAPDIEQILLREDVLTVRGFAVGSVTSHLPELGRNQARHFRKHLSAVEDTIRQVHKGTPSLLQQTVAMTLQAGTTSTAHVADEKESGEAYEIYKRALANIDSAYPYHNANLSKMSAVAQKLVASQFALAMTNACYDRKFFSATGGRFGLGPKTIENGDLVAILYGSPFPVVLRSSGGHADDYEFVGVCYIHGIMKGEAVGEHSTNGGVDVLYRIR